MAKAVNDKSTKGEILDAYNDLVARLKEQKAADAKGARKEAEEQVVVKAASQSSIDSIVRRHADLKLDIVKTMDDLEEKLIVEFRKFAELQQAVAIEARFLEEIHEIKVEAETLTALVLAQKEKKVAFDTEIGQKREDFDAEITQKKSQWKKDQEEYEAQKKERDSQVKKERQREEEEYTYNLQLVRKKDKDLYEAKKAALEKELMDKKTALEKELTEREAAIAVKEKELAELHTKVETFPKDLEKTVKETEKTVTERLEFKYRHEAALAAKEIEGERKLHRQIVSALESKIGEQEELVRQLTEKANESVQQVQTIAIKAIEGASAQRTTVERPREG